MIIVLERGTTPAETEQVLSRLADLGLSSKLLTCLDKPIVHIVAGPAGAARKLQRMPRVEALVPTSGPRVRSTGRHFYPYHFINWFSAALVFLGLLVLLAGFFPPGVGAQIDPRAAAPDVTVAWYLSAPGAFLELFPLGAELYGWLTLGLVAALVLLLPLIDRTRAELGGVRRIPLYALSAFFMGGLYLMLSRLF